MFALEDEYEVFTTTQPEEGLSLMAKEEIDVVLLDMRIKDVNGLTLIPQMLQVQPELIIIMMTAYGTIESSVTALQLGAFHYLTKPVNIAEVKALLEKGLRFTALNTERKRLYDLVHPAESYAGIVGKSSEMKRVFTLMEKVKDITSNVLILGESGTGKELVAKGLHEESERKNKPFCVLNCAAIPETLMESELFGHEKGAFTGAIQSKEGIFEKAHEGTLFLDEIGEMPLHLQAKLLRILQNGEVTRIGSTQTKKVDVRILAATNRNLSDEVNKGQFREDLFYRLHVIPIELPPLRKRLEDVPLLLDHFLKLFCEKIGREVNGFQPQVKELLYSYTYPGNVRELANIIEYSVAMTDGEISVEDLPANLQFIKNKEVAAAGNHQEFYVPPNWTLEQMEKETIRQTLSRLNGHRQQTADALGISERSLRDRIKRYSIER
ncbi:regulator [Fictibacillus phosphorivorans]|uniref:Regulator n=2 Tax=Fictibacillus phosphorivorans TaxID=1221500 RepID=A0A163Q0H8_9BACL|nr:regulator [Fictibacillus phosphorivorans]